MSNKYSKELERIKMLKSINSVLKKGDIENALLSNSAKDSEIVSDTTIENMMDNLNIGKGSDKDIEIIERLTKYSAGDEIKKKKSVKIRKTRGKTKIKVSMHVKKKKGNSSTKAARKRKR
jgi:hypothetical protein